MQYFNRGLLITVLVAVVVGGGAGVVTSIATSRSLDDYANTLLGDRGFLAWEPRKPNSNPLDYANATNKVREAQSRSLAVITLKSTDTLSPANWIGPESAVGLGVVASANGWILTTKDELGSVQNPKTSLEVWIRGTRYTIAEQVNDDATPYVLLKLAEANGLTPLAFGASEDAANGDMVFGLSAATGFVATTVQNTELPIISGPHQAEAYAGAWELAEASALPGPVLSTAGEMLAFVTKSGEAVPVHHGVDFIQDTLRSGVTTRASLGAYVVDIADVYNLDSQLRQGLSTGALVLAPAGKIAVPTGTPAAAAGLLARDIITAVDGEAITPEVSLAEILATYNPGQTARFSVVRAQAPLELTVILGDAATLVY
ncbi:MAG: S1C family serine protease [Patescibacteria group bacterium]